MESEDDYQSFSPPNETSPPVQHRRLKRMKKTTIPKESPVNSVSELIFLPRIDFARLEALESSEIRGFEDSSEPFPSEGFDDKELSTGFDELGVNGGDRKVTKRPLGFDDAANEFDGKGVEGEINKIVDLKVEGGVKEKKGKKKRVKSSGGESKDKTAYSNKKKEEKERRVHLQKLHAESQRLLRETRGAAFKPVPVVQKPISSVLEKIRLRKLEMSKKFFPSKNLNLIGENDGCSKEVEIDHANNISAGEREVENIENLVEEKKVACSGDVKPRSDASHIDGLKLCGEQINHDNAPSQMVLDEESTPAFRAPVDDTQDLFGDSQTSDGKDEVPSDQNSSPQEEVMEPSWLTMKLKFDSAPDDISDEEDNEKENVDPHPLKLDNECSSPKGDPVKAFVDDEAEEEDDSDNDLMRFREDEEDEDNGDFEELNDMIANNYKERPIDNECRNELHQKWLEEKDATGTDDLMRRLNCVQELGEASLLDEEEDDEDGEFSNEAEEDVGRRHVARLDSRKAKQMIAQMFSDKDEAFLSSDDEETEKRLVRRCLLDKAEEQATLLSPVEDENSREVFGLIKKLNIVPKTKKAAKSSSFFDTMLTGGNSNSSSKSSFLSRASSHSVPTSRKQGSTMVRSFIFGRDDSNSRSSISMSEDSSDTFSRETQTRKAPTRFSSSQSRSSTQITKIVGEAPSGTSLLEILKRSSAQANACNHDSMVDLSQSVFAAFKVPKKPIKIAGRI